MLDLCKIKYGKYYFNSPIIAYFQKRNNRFVSYHKHKTLGFLVAHCPHEGSMESFLIKNTLTILSKKNIGLPYTWEAIKVNNYWFGVNLFVPNKLVKLMLDNGLIP